MEPGLLSGGVALVTLIASTMIAWGTMRTRTDDMRVEIMRLRDAVHRHGNLIAELSVKIGAVIRDKGCKYE